MLITNAQIVTWETPNRIIADGALLIRDGLIAEVGAARELAARHPTAERLDARGQFVMPGGICAHTHFYGALARGMALPGDPPRDFPDILRRLWWQLDKALDQEAVRLSALVCLVDAIKHGTTTLFDHHASPNAIEGSLNTIAAAAAQAGLRAVLCYEVSDRDGVARRDEGIAENRRFIRDHADHPTIRGIFGLHASMTLSDETLRLCIDANPAPGFHIHVAEHEADQEDALARYGRRVVQRLHDFSVLGAGSIAAHAIHLDEAERALLAQTRTWVTHQPRSNMNNGVGAMPLDAMMASGLRERLCLGNDGFSNAMWEEWKAAYLLHKSVHRDPRRANGADIAQMAAVNNARMASTFFGETIGQLIPGAAADMILVDYHPITPLNTENLAWHILFGFESSMVTTTICAGQVLMRDRRLLTLDEAALAAEARALAPSVWARCGVLS